MREYPEGDRDGGGGGGGGGEGRGRALLLGTAALITWFATLWFMFGDVL